jgi:hypothetical protein
MNARPLADSVDFFVVPLVGIPFGDHDVEIEDSATKSVNPLSEFVGHEFGHFGLVDEELLQLVEVVVVEDLDNFLEL